MEKANNIIVLGKPLSLDRKVLNSEDILKMYNEKGLSFISEIDGLFGIQIDGKIFTEKTGLFPVFFDPETKEIYENIEINDINTSFIEDSRSYNDIHYNSILDMKIFDSGKFEDQYNIYKYLKYFSTLDILKKLLIFDSLYDINNNIYINNIYINNNILYRENYEDRFLKIIERETKNKKVLLSLSFGRDSRLILAALLKLGIDFDYISFGKESILVDRYLKPIIGKDKIEINTKYIFDHFDEIIYNHIFDYNGFGDIFYDCNQFYLEDTIYPQYDVILFGHGSNEFYNSINNKEKVFMYKLRYLTGLGHSLKNRFIKNNAFFPYIDQILINSTSKNITKNIFFDKLIDKIYPDLGKIPKQNFFPSMSEKRNRFGIEFSENTRLKYLLKLKERILAKK